MLQRSTLALLAVALLPAAFARAETKAERFQAASDLVKEALHLEVYGESHDRETLLRQALSEAPNLETAHWHLGHVKVRGKWVAFDEAAEAVKENRLLAEYRHRRKAIADDAEGHLSLADWCREHNLEDRERAHLSRVVELAPDHRDARRRLGHTRVGGQWLTAEERREEFERAKAQRKSLAEWRPEMRDIARGLSRRGLAQREAAELRLGEIADPAAIAAMEEVICPLGEEASKLVVETIAAMNEHEASVALARQAVYSPHEAVRELACEKLKSRPKEDFVPPLLTSLQTPVITRSQIYRGQGGSLVCRHVATREGQDNRNVAVFETEYNRVARLGGSRDDTLARALEDAQRNQIIRNAAASRENTQTMVFNRRVMSTLEKATGQVLPPTPQDWWTWWNDVNEVFVQTNKPVQLAYRRDQVSIVDRVPNQTGPDDQRTSGGTQQPTGQSIFRGDCLAAGTKVWTELGPMAIEEIRVGDRVLAQDPETGELAYKPVLGTTIRPAGRLVRINVGQDSVTTSGGHLYWVAGDGWKKARELTSGDEIHSVRGTVGISNVEKAELAPTYNLIVADFHSYFVGAGLIYCHDNTIREPTNSLVPGLNDY